MFKIGFRSYITLEHLEIAKRIGMEVIEVMWEDTTRARADEVKDLLREYAIHPSAMTVDISRDFAEFKRDIDFAESIGCPVFVAHPNPLRRDDTEAIRAFKAYWTHACEYAGDKGVRASVHSCGLDPESWDIMLGEVPGLGLKYDPSFSAQAGRDCRMEILRYGNRISHVHSKDELSMGRTTDFSKGIIPYKYVPTGMGDIHWGSLIALLYEAGYQGDIAVEVHSGFWHDHLERCLILSKRHLEQFIV